MTFKLNSVILKMYLYTSMKFLSQGIQQLRTWKNIMNRIQGHCPLHPLQSSQNKTCKLQYLISTYEFCMDRQTDEQTPLKTLPTLPLSLTCRSLKHSVVLRVQMIEFLHQNKHTEQSRVNQCFEMWGCPRLPAHLMYTQDPFRLTGPFPIMYSNS